MKKTFIALLAVTALLSLAAGVPKVLRMPQELEFLSALGFGAALVVLLGVIQILGGVLMAMRRTRLAGAILAGVGFAVSAAAIFAGGQIGFAAVSLVPILLVGLVIGGTRRLEASGA